MTCPRCAMQSERQGICAACSDAAEQVIFDRWAERVFFPAVWPLWSPTKEQG